MKNHKLFGNFYLKKKTSFLCVLLKKQKISISKIIFFKIPNTTKSIIFNLLSIKKCETKNNLSGEGKNLQKIDQQEYENIYSISSFRMF